MTRKTKQSHAFTLVELLVVIGIIAVLVGVLLPVLGSGRGAAMNVKCLSNLRQCGQALWLYADNNKGYIVPVRAGGSPPQASNTPGTDTTQAVPYDLYGFTYGWTSSDATHNTSAAWWMNFLAKYLSSYRGAGDGNVATAALVQFPVLVSGVGRIPASGRRPMGSRHRLFDELHGFADADPSDPFQ